MTEQRTTVRNRAELLGRRIDVQLKTECLVDELLDMIFPHVSVKADNRTKITDSIGMVEKRIYNCMEEYRSWRAKDIVEQEVNQQLAELKIELEAVTGLPPVTIPADTAQRIVQWLKACYDDKVFLEQLCQKHGVLSAIKRFLFTHGDAEILAKDSKNSVKAKRVAEALEKAANDYHKLDDKTTKELLVAMMKKNVELPILGSDEGNPYAFGGVLNNWMEKGAPPTREILLRVAFGLKLNDAEAKELLRSGQQDSFNPLSLYDTVIRYGLSHSMTLLQTTRLYESCFLECLKHLPELNWRGFGTDRDVVLPTYHEAEQKVLGVLCLDEEAFKQAVMPLVRFSKEEMIAAVSAASVLKNADAYINALTAYTNSGAMHEVYAEAAQPMVKKKKQALCRLRAEKGIQKSGYCPPEESIAGNIKGSINVMRRRKVIIEVKRIPTVLGKALADGKNAAQGLTPAQAVKRTKADLEEQLRFYTTDWEYVRQKQIQKRLQKQINLLKLSVNNIRIELAADELIARIENQCELVEESLHYAEHPEQTARCQEAIQFMEQRTAQLMAYLLDGVCVTPRNHGANAFTEDRIVKLLHCKETVQRSDVLRAAYFETLLRHYLLKVNNELYDEVSIPVNEAVEFFEKTGNELLRDAMYPEVYVRSSLDCLMIHALCQAEDCIRVYQTAIPNTLGNARWLSDSETTNAEALEYHMRH